MGLSQLAHNLPAAVNTFPIQLNDVSMDSDLLNIKAQFDPHTWISSKIFTDYQARVNSNPALICFSPIFPQALVLFREAESETSAIYGLYSMEKPKDSQVRLIKGGQSGAQASE